MSTRKKEKSEKSSQGRSSRVTVRWPELVDGFSRRITHLLAESGVSQRDLAKSLGGFRNDALSRIVRGVAVSVPIDFLVKLGGWADVRGFSLRWLLCGVGQMRKDDIPKTPDMVRAANELGAYRMIMTLADRAGIDLGDISVETNVMSYVPDFGVVSIPLPDLISHVEEKLKGKTSELRGYSTVAAEDVPTRHDWHEHYVPVIGRVAAGEGVDVAEASEYPPAWANEFLVYDGAPKTAVAVRVLGNSMEPKYHDGDMVIVDPAVPAGAGEVCCVLVDRDGVREARLKRLKLQGRYAMLESTNPDYAQGAERISASRLIAAFRIVDHLAMVRI